MELVSSLGLRLDGRREMQMRNFKVTLSSSEKADGSALYQIGNTMVMATVKGPYEHYHYTTPDNEEAIINTTVKFAPFSKIDIISRFERSSLLISHVITNLFNENIIRNQYPRTKIDINVMIMQNDGGIYSACINAAYLAVSDACISQYGSIASCTIGIYEDKILLDLIGKEEMATKSQMYLVYQMTQKRILNFENLKGVISKDKLNECLEKCIKGCHLINDYFNETLRNETEKLILLKNVN